LTNLYLAQLLKEEYIDFVLTVNFDDLILRACALFNFLPPVYDVSNVKVPTTSNFREQSVIYLHGQHYGQWLLNEPEELKKVSNDIANIFNEIKNKRTWIIIGYSGQDEIFNQIVKLGSFTSDLFWINYKDHEPSENIMKRLISKLNTNAHLIKGYDSDTFMLELHSELGLDTPELLNKPFSFLKKVVNGIKDIDDIEKNEHEEKYKKVKERLDIGNLWIDRAITEIEDVDSVEKFKQQIIEAYLKGEFSENEKNFLEKFSDSAFKAAANEMSDFYELWGLSCSRLAEISLDRVLFEDSFNKYNKSIEVNPKNASAYYNWAHTLIVYSSLFDKEERREIILRSQNKAKKAYSIDNDFVYNLACTYALLEDKKNALKFLEETLKKEKVKKESIIEDSDWKSYLDDIDFKKLMGKY